MRGERCLELADGARVARLAKAPNAELVWRHRDGKLVEIQLHEAGDDSRKRGRAGNPLRYSHDHETADNPENVWTLREIPSEARRVFTAVLLDCLSERRDD
jgi:hypothetical protein